MKLTKLILNWKTTAAILTLLLIAIIFKVHVPFGIYVYKEGKLFYEQYKIRNSSDKLSSDLNSIRKEIFTLDSLIQYQATRKQGNQGSIAEVLYSFADSANLKTSKVEIGERLSILNHTEIPVSVRGIGSYGAVGKFVEFTENAQQSTRIRQIVLKSDGKDEVEAYLDFVLME